ncbi:hypothetical protein M433DRAFT_361195 [Acidomyces richmondensis BFW]|nr:MAG: hypothetical protein FE78DRAFT_135396 [Acidomyces sp. 'richmondensis']KYG49034.1 hypothetical protein M433DRAFT_361195 [Acidomyces richmondensis BFW]
MGREEQREEREVLESIFPDEIQDISDSEYRISIKLDVNEGFEENTCDPIIILNVRLTEEYPDEAPRLDITQPPNSPKHPQLDIQEDKAQLLEALKPVIDENMGMAMVFTLVSTLKDSAELLIVDRQRAIQAQKDLESRKAEEEENRKFEGEKVTRASFLAWREKFRKEMAEESMKRQAEVEAEERKKRGGKVEEKRLTGKQLWEQGLAGKVMDEEEDGEDAVENLQKVKIEA